MYFCVSSPPLPSLVAHHHLYKASKDFISWSLTMHRIVSLSLLYQEKKKKIKKTNRCGVRGLSGCRRKEADLREEEKGRRAGPSLVGGLRSPQHLLPWPGGGFLPLVRTQWVCLVERMLPVLLRGFIVGHREEGFIGLCFSCYQVP